MSQGLPPAAQARLENARDQHTWTSSVSVDEFSCLRAAGFEPVGQVMGSTVHNLGWWYGSMVDCGYRRGYGAIRTVTSGTRGGWGGYSAYVNTLYEARHTAMNRMSAECAALGGDGVVAVELTIEPFRGAANTLEFQAIGTAVRAQGDRRPPKPFLSHVTGQEFAKLIEAGWVPVDMVFGSSIGVRHDDWRTQWSTGRYAPPQEVSGWTELVAVTRQEARQHVRRDAARVGGRGVVLSDVDLKVHERECSFNENQHDHVVETTVIGTAIAEFRTSHHPPSTLKIMRL